MRKFFVLKTKHIKYDKEQYTHTIGKTLTMMYLCFFLVLSYRIIYNEFYLMIHDDIQVSNEKGQFVYPSGEIVGIYTECEGVFVIETCEIETIDSEFINPAKNLLRTGDYIIQVNGHKLETKETLVHAVKECNGKPLELKIVRGDEIISETITPVLGKNRKYMLGVWVKDDLAGVGTITYSTPTGEFAALGHGMGDGVTKELLSVKGGDIYISEIVGIEKGKRGEPGEVKGVIYYGLINHLGELDTNCSKGIYGTLDQEDRERYIDSNSACEIGKKQEIKTGKAQIISDVSGKRQVYDIEITYIDYLATNSNKELHIKVTDQDLIELTGGIVQGMSGSPIIQDGKLVGAVTHVLVNDPTRGYGIFIENMLDAAR